MNIYLVSGDDADAVVVAESGPAAVALARKHAANTTDRVELIGQADLHFTRSRLILLEAR